MRFLHLADLHLGKSIHGVSLLENGDQPFWVERFLSMVRQLRPDAVVIAGDIYDRSAPSGAAVQLLDHMLTELAGQDIPVLLVAGNHDSGPRLSFGGALLARQKIHIAGVLPRTKQLDRVTLTDEHGPVTFWLLPYVFPALAAQALGEEIRDYDTAVRRLLAAQDIDFSGRNVLVAHQNVTAGGAEAVRGGSESMVGGVGQIDYTAFDGFDYVALGHIHAAYPVGRESVRYAGSPLCYHFEETKQRPKGPVLVTLGEKGEAPGIETLRIPPLHPMRELRGGYEELRGAMLASDARDEYLRIVLTDRRVTPETSHFFYDLCQARGSVLMEIVSEYRPFGAADSVSAAADAQAKPVEALFGDFYAERSGGEAPSARDAELLRFAGEQLRHAEAGAPPTEEQIDALLAFLMEQEGQA